MKSKPPYIERLSLCILKPRARFPCTIALLCGASLVPLTKLFMKRSRVSDMFHLESCI